MPITFSFGKYMREVARVYTKPANNIIYMADLIVSMGCDRCKMSRLTGQIVTPEWVYFMKLIGEYLLVPQRLYRVELGGFYGWV